MARKKKSSLGCLFYLALVLLVIVVFLFQWDTVRGVIDRTGFLKALRDRGTTGRPAPAVTVVPERRPEPPAPAVRPAPDRTAPDPEGSASAPSPAPAAKDAPERDRPAARDVVVQVHSDPSPTAAPARPAAPAAQTARPADARVRRSKIYFASAGADGAVTLREVFRSVDYVDAPLRATLEALMRGPTPAELDQGLFSTIPPESRLDNLYIRGDTAFLDFNESFRFNALGTEGLRTQLKQLVYSTTEFSNIGRVQFLIEGRKTRFLGPEGTFIGEPLSRDSFR